MTVEELKACLQPYESLKNTWGVFTREYRVRVYCGRHGVRLSAWAPFGTRFSYSRTSSSLDEALEIAARFLSKRGL